MKHILITDDDEFLINMYKLSLQEIEDASIETAEDGQKAIDKIDQHQPDVLILDLLMPGVNGYDVMHHIRKKGYTFPVIVLTNVSSEKGQQLCAEMGAKDYFNKSSMDLEKLMALVKRSIEH